MFSTADLTALILGDTEIADLDAPGLQQACRTIARARGMLDTMDAALVTRAAELHSTGAGPAPSEMLALAGHLTHRDARRAVERASTISAVPALADALDDGTISTAHADAITRASNTLDDTTKQTFLAHSDHLIAAATKLPPETFARECKRLADHLGDGGLTQHERQRRATRLRHWIDRDTGMYELHASLDPETGHALFHALDTEVETLFHTGADTTVEHLDRDPQHLAAHALARLVHRGHHHTNTSTPTTAEITVLIDLHTLIEAPHQHGTCELDDGTPIPADTARRYACDAGIIPVVLGGDGVALDVGRTRRLATSAQRRALRAMYRTCAFPHCDVDISRCQPHHLHPWDAGGTTDLHNLLPLCHRHHHLVHEGRWRLSLDADRTLTITRPDGTHHATTPLPNRPLVAA